MKTPSKNEKLNKELIKRLKRQTKKEQARIEKEVLVDFHWRRLEELTGFRVSLSGEMVWSWMRKKPKKE